MSQIYISPERLRTRVPKIRQSPRIFRQIFKKQLRIDGPLEKLRNRRGQKDILSHKHKFEWLSFLFKLSIINNSKTKHMLSRSKHFCRKPSPHARNGTAKETATGCAHNWTVFVALISILDCLLFVKLYLGQGNGSAT